MYLSLCECVFKCCSSVCGGAFSQGSNLPLLLLLLRLCCVCLICGCGLTLALSLSRGWDCVENSIKARKSQNQLLICIYIGLGRAQQARNLFHLHNLVRSFDRFRSCAWKVSLLADLHLQLALLLALSLCHAIENCNSP